MQLVESFRDEAGKLRQRTLATLGRLDQTDGQVDALIDALLRAEGGATRSTDRGHLNSFVVAFDAAFDAAPGASSWEVIRGLADGPSGLSPTQLASLITGTPQFQAAYPPRAMSGGVAGGDKAYSRNQPGGANHGGIPQALGVHTATTRCACV